MAGLSIKDEQARYNQLMKGFEEGKKAGLQLQIAKKKPRDTGNPYNDMTGISGGKPLEKGTPMPKEMQLPIPGIDWEKVHTPWDVDSLIEKWGAVQDPAGEWMIPTKEGTLRYATPEEQLMIEEDFQHRKENSLYDGHEHQASIYMGEQFPNEFDRVLNPKGDFSRPSLDQLREGVKIKKKTKAI